MDNAAPGAVLHVVVAASPQAGQVLEQLLRLPLGATVADAVQASGWAPGGVPFGFSYQTVIIHQFGNQKRRLDSELANSWVNGP